MPQEAKMPSQDLRQVESKKLHGAPYGTSVAHLRHRDRTCLDLIMSDTSEVSDQFECSTSIGCRSVHVYAR